MPISVIAKSTPSHEKELQELGAVWGARRRNGAVTEQAVPHLEAEIETSSLNSLE